MGEINSHRDLLVWQQAMNLAATIYEVSRSWPKEETSARIDIESQTRVAGPLEQCESVGKLLRLLVRKLEQSDR